MDKMCSFLVKQVRCHRMSHTLFCHPVFLKKNDSLWTAASIFLLQPFGIGCRCPTPKEHNGDVETISYLRRDLMEKELSCSLAARFILLPPRSPTLGDPVRPS